MAAANWYPGARHHGYELREAIPGTDLRLWRAAIRGTGTDGGVADTVIIKRLDPAEREAVHMLLSRNLPGRHLIAFRELHDDAAVMDDGGDTLRAVLDRGGLVPDDRNELVRLLFAGLADLHQASLSHGDLKPLNVMVRQLDRPASHERWELRLIDFGLTTVLPDADEVRHTLADTSPLSGTPFYMDPTLADGRPRSARSDLFAAGIIAFEILTDRRPSYGDPLPEWLERCIGHHDARFRDAVDVVRMLAQMPYPIATVRPLTARRMADTGPQSFSGPSRSTADSGSDGSGRYFTSADLDQQFQLLRACIADIVEATNGNPPLSGEAFHVIASELYVQGIADGFTLDQLRRLLEREAAGEGSKPAISIWRDRAPTGLPAEARLVTPGGDHGDDSGPRVQLQEPGPLDPHELAVIQSRGVPTAVRFLPDSRMLLTGSSDQTLRLWHLEAGSVVHGTGIGTARPTPRGAAKAHWNWIRDLAVAANGSVALSASDDSTARVWNVHRKAGTLEAVGVLRGCGKLRGVAVTPDGRRAITAATDGMARVWNLCDPSFAGQNHFSATAVLDSHSDALNAVAITPDGRWALTASDDASAVLWWLGRSANPDVILPVALICSHEAPIRDVAFVSGGAYLLTASTDGTVRVWPMPREEPTATTSTRMVHPLTVMTHHSPVTRIAMSPAGTRLAVALESGAIALHELHDDETSFPIARHVATLPGHIDGVTSVAFSSDGRWLASASWDHTVRVWSLVQGAR